MGIKHSVWSLDKKQELHRSALINENELEIIIFSNINILNENWIVLGQQIKTKNGGYIDILCLDREGSTIVVELKKDLTPREVTAQGLDYASWVSKLEIQDLAKIHLEHMKSTINEAYQAKFKHALDDSTINLNTKVVIVATKMDASTEDIINYLQSFGVDINILFFTVYEANGDRLLSRSWFIDEEPTFVERIREWNGEFYVSYGVGPSGRSWNDACKYGFISAGGGSWYTNTLSMLHIGDRFWVNIPGIGYAGVGVVTEEAKPVKDVTFTVDDTEVPFLQLSLDGKYYTQVAEEEQEYIVKVKWIRQFDMKNAVKETGFFGNQNTVCKPTSEKWDFTVKRLKEKWNIVEQ
jgi:hypothetical protein